MLSNLISKFHLFEKQIIHFKILKMDAWKRIDKKVVPKLIETTVKLHPDRNALSIFNGETITYRELHRRITKISGILKEKGVVKGDKIALIGENSPNWVIAYLSTVFLGGVIVPILADFHPEDVSNILKHSESIGLFATRAQLMRLSGYDFGNVRFIITLDDFEPDDSELEVSPIFKLYDKAKEAIYDLAEKFGLYGKCVEEDDLAAIIYTSGTTGNSKGVMLTHKNIVTNVIQVAKIFDMNQNDRLLSILPLAHAYEFTLGLLYPLSVGAHITYLGKKPVPGLIQKAAESVKPTVIAAVPMILEKIYKMKIQPLLETKKMKILMKSPLRRMILKKIRKKLIDFFGGELRAMTLGGAPFSEDIEDFYYKIKFPYATGYGLTETAPLISGSLVKETKKRASGRIVEWVEVKIKDPEPETGIGEIYIKGPNVMKGYYKNMELTLEVLSEDGWFKTGDLGYVDEDNFIYIKGRSKNMILGPSGENIFPEIIEEKLNMHVYVLESIVYEKDGRIVGKVYLNYDLLKDKLEGHSEENRDRIVKEILREIREKTNERLPRYSQIYELYEHPEPFEKTPTNKIKRYLYTG